MSIGNIIILFCHIYAFTFLEKKINTYLKNIVNDKQCQTQTLYIINSDDDSYFFLSFSGSHQQQQRNVLTLAVSLIIGDESQL
jgi:hypothetical protein